MNPVSYLIEGVRSLIVVGWDGQALALGFGVAGAIAVIATVARRLGAAAEAGGVMRTLAVAHGVAWRMLHNLFHNKALLIPSIAFPLFFFTAFAGGLAGISNVPGFDFPDGYTAFQFVFVLLQSAAFAGVFTGFGIARDFETGFARRLLLASSNRSGIVLGYAVAAIVRWLVTAALLTVIALRRADEGRRRRRRPLRPVRARRRSSTSRRRSGRPASRCGCARCRPGRSCRCRSSSSSSSRRCTCRCRCSRAGSTRVAVANPLTPRDRGRPRLHLGRAGRRWRRRSC